MKPATRLMFYARLGVEPPSYCSNLVTYVAAFQDFFSLRSRNEARDLLAAIEGYPSWETLVTHRGASLNHSRSHIPCSLGNNP